MRSRHRAVARARRTGARRRRSAQLHQLRHRTPVRRVRLAAARRIPRTTCLPAAGRPGHAEPRLLPRPHEWRWRACKYQAYVEKMLNASGTPDADAKAKAIFDLETKIAKAHAASSKATTCTRPTIPWPARRLRQARAGHRLAAFFDAAGLSGQPIVLAWQPNAIRSSRAGASEPLQTWKDYLRFHAINHGAGLLPKAYADAAFDFYGTTLSGTPKQRRSLEARGRFDQQLARRRGRRDLRRAVLPASSKAQVEGMVKNIVAAFDERSPSWTG
jgi:putative endopeptidase